jgi:hypothetical protein
MSKDVFILGASDIEMNAIEALLTRVKARWYAATVNGIRVKPGMAYQANGLKGFPARRKLDPARTVMVECHLTGFEPAKIIDHHNEGDPGYEMPPERYLEGSSLGQVAAYLGVELTHEEKCIAAGDHCLNYAYQGLCPGVDVETLKKVRAHYLAKHNRISPEEMSLRLEEGYKRLMSNAEPILVGNEEVLLLTEEIWHIQEISARASQPLIYKVSCPEGTKVGILNARKETVEYWMQHCDLNHVYGNPHRGYAGGYM